MLTPAVPQISILVSTAMLTEGTKWGIGLHYEDMDYENKMWMVALISYSAGFATILAAAWSKTSFGITLLRISTGPVRWVIWFIIISVNIVLGVSAAIMWTRCWPVAKLWFPEIEGNCWTTVTMERYQTFTSGKVQAIHGKQQEVALPRPTLANNNPSLFRLHGYRACYPPVEDRLERRYQQTGKVRRAGRYEHGRVVGLPSQLVLTHYCLHSLTSCRPPVLASLPS